jgi:ankyrin repeat protein
VPGGFTLAYRPFPVILGPDNCQAKMTEDPAIPFFETAWTAMVEGDRQLKHLERPKAADEAAQLTMHLIDLLLAAGADINLRASLDVTALHMAACWSSPTVIRHLLACGANPNTYDGDYTPHCPADNAKFAKRWEVAALLREAMKSNR